MGTARVARDISSDAGRASRERGAVSAKAEPDESPSPNTRIAQAAADFSELIVASFSDSETMGEF